MNSALMQAACVAVPKGLGGALTIILNGWLLSRMTPAEFGLYAVCLTLVTLGDAVIGAAIDMSVVKLASAHRVHDVQRAAAVERLGVVAKVCVLGLIVLLALAFATPLSQALFHRDDPALLMLVLSVVTGVLLSRSISTHLQLGQRFKAYAGLELFAQALRVSGICAVLLWFEPTARTLTWAALAGAALALLAGLRIARLSWPAPGARGFAVGERREFLHAVRWMFATFAFSSLLARIDLLLLTRWSTIEQVGLYAAAQVFALIPEMLGLWLAVVFSPRVAPARANGTLRPMMRRVQLALGIVALVLGLLAWLGMSLGGQWLPAGYAGASEVLLPLVVGALAGMFALPLTVPFIMFTRPGFIVAVDLISLPFLLLAYHWAIGEAGAVGAAWVSGGARIFKTALLQGMAWAWTRPHLGPMPGTSTRTST